MYFYGISSKHLKNEGTGWKEKFPLKRLVLFDIDKECQKPVGKYGRFFSKSSFRNWILSIIQAPEESYEGMDFIFMQMHIIDLSMRAKDEQILNHSNPAAGKIQSRKQYTKIRRGVYGIIWFYEKRRICITNGRESASHVKNPCPGIFRKTYGRRFCRGTDQG